MAWLFLDFAVFKSAPFLPLASFLIISEPKRRKPFWTSVNVFWFGLVL
jgi:hypothetical protein